MQFEFATATRIVFGKGSFKQLPELVVPFGRRVLIVHGKISSRASVLSQSLASHGLESRLFAVAKEPTVDLVRDAVRVAMAEACECVISIGGGSVIDAGKAVAALMANPGSILDYLEVIGRGRALEHAPVPFIAIPTTAGTGAEVTRNAVLASPEQQVKVSLRSPLMLPKIAVIDPELTYDLPPALTASTGLDALTQLIEPYVSCRANPITDGFCMEGMRRVASSLLRAYRDGQDACAHEEMALASLMGGLALANAGLGAVHGFAAPIGGAFDAPHGAVCAALLPHVMETNVRALRARDAESVYLRRYTQVARILTGDPNASIEDGINRVRRLCAEMRIPSLAAYGVKEEHMAELVAKAGKASSMRGNPIVLTERELAEILRAAID